MGVPTAETNTLQNIEHPFDINVEKLNIRYGRKGTFMYSGRMNHDIGVFPDEEVWHTREALRAGRDRVLEVAVEWIRSQ